MGRYIAGEKIAEIYSSFEDDETAEVALGMNDKKLIETFDKLISGIKFERNDCVNVLYYMGRKVNFPDSFLKVFEIKKLVIPPSDVVVLDSVRSDNYDIAEIKSENESERIFKISFRRVPLKCLDYSIKELKQSEYYNGKIFQKQVNWVNNPRNTNLNDTEVGITGYFLDYLIMGKVIFKFVNDKGKKKEYEFDFEPLNHFVKSDDDMTKIDEDGFVMSVSIKNGYITIFKGDYLERRIKISDIKYGF